MNWVILISVFVLAGFQEKDKSLDFTKEGLFTSGIEGPAVNSEGLLYAVNFEREGTIGQVTMEGKASVFVELPNGSVGNGIRFDKNDNMYIADYVNHNVLYIPQGSKDVSIYAHHKDLNQPNDLAIAPNGILYASDPNWKESTGKLWMVSKDGFHLLEENMGTTNGVEVSPDGKTLYVNESVQRKIWKYDIEPSGKVGNKSLFYSFDDHGLDGMRCDNKGNLYVCRYDAGQVVVLSPESRHLRTVILTGKKPTNIAFGGKDGRQCFVTMQGRGCIETFKAEHPGRNF
ncbi:SMP-30/gluconolactonase/LRE family protein [Lutimonas zeaxanthinifaciens]|uniref:SMP-30/gluconolactonase/LRE family protein n=1 Tax=Lutimonas zeaxanthinifaciens TaxID=3060215 RepID=UPI00265D051A|nr:SMP-30/gluconolactonase/LRE family protein [Lutimonas sp. YSD2104]WKK66982.1 SMP-30/gluconolactonase/LRE family protein [Lutimonas sp. YSD2104]